MPIFRSASLNRPLNSWDIAKLIALLLMFIDHAGYFFYPDSNWLRAIGRGAAPIFMFLAGYAASYRIKPELWLLAALMSLSDFLMAGLRTQNILVTIIVSRLIFAWHDKHYGPIKRPYEWYIGALAFFFSMFAVQYGSLGFIIALAGYVMRRSTLYPGHVPGYFLLLALITYGISSQLLFDFTLDQALLMGVVLTAIYCGLARFTVHDIGAHWPVPVRRAAKLISYSSGYIYALHLIALEWLTGKPF